MFSTPIYEKYGILISGIAFGLLLPSTVFCQEEIKYGESNMINVENKQLVLRLFEEVFNKQSLTVIEDIYAPDVTDHSAFLDQVPGIEGIKGAIKGFFEAFDIVKITVEDVIAEDDKVVTRETWTVTHKPSGKTVQGSVIHIFRIHDGRISDEWSGGWEWLDNL